MSQMMPLYWVTLLIFFSSLMILFNVMNFYMYLNKPNMILTPKTMTKMLTWKW
nr:ATP synthase F0 subunit 8 [Popa spurca]